MLTFLFITECLIYTECLVFGWLLYFWYTVCICMYTRVSNSVALLLKSKVDLEWWHWKEQARLKSVKSTRAQKSTVICLRDILKYSRLVTAWYQLLRNLNSIHIYGKFHSNWDVYNPVFELVETSFSIHCIGEIYFYRGENANDQMGLILFFFCFLFHVVCMWVS